MMLYNLGLGLFTLLFAILLLPLVYAAFGLFYCSYGVLRLLGIRLEVETEAEDRAAIDALSDADALLALATLARRDSRVVLALKATAECNHYAVDALSAISAPESSGVLDAGVARVARDIITRLSARAGLNALASGKKRRIKSARSQISGRGKPPASAQFILELLASPEWSDNAAGDFFERYQRKFKRVRSKHGVFAAKADYWWQVLRSTPGLLNIRFRNVAAVAAIAKLFETLYRFLGIT